MRLVPSLALSLLFSAVTHAENVALVSGIPAQHGQPLTESAHLTLDHGKLSASLNGLQLAGAAVAQFTVRMEREITSATHQSINIRDSTHAIAFTFGGAPPSLEPKPSAVAAKQTEAHLEQDRWKLRLQSGDPDDSQKKALEYLGTYLTLVDLLLPQLYGTEHRTVGESWQPDLRWTQDAPLPVAAEATLTVTGTEHRNTTTIATITLNGRLRVVLSATATLDLFLDGTILRDLDHQTDLDTQLTGDLSLTGDLGKSLPGPATIDGKVQLVRQITLVEP